MSKGLRPEEIRTCNGCNGPIAPICYRITVETHGFDTQACKQLIGMQMMLGSRALANVMSPVSEATKVLNEQSLILCLECATHTNVLQAQEMAGEEAGDDERRR